MHTGNTGEHSDKLKELDKSAIEDPKLVGGVEARLANLNKLTQEPDDDNQADDDKSTPAGNESADKDSPTPDVKKDGDTDVVKEDELPPAFVRAAVHRGWKEEDVQAFYEANPEAALKTFQNCYMDVNNASREWALLGKAKIEKDNILRQPEPKDQPKFEGVDVKKLKEDYDLDDKTVAILEAQNRQLEEASRHNVQPVSQPVQQKPVGPDPNVELQVENFFSGNNLKDYSDFYGSLNIGQDWSDLGHGQYSNRWRVLEQANMILVGAESMNKQMDPVEALERAHMMISEPVRERVIRERIKNDVTKRSNSMTIKPSAGSRSVSKVSSDVGEPKKARTRDELASDVQERLHSIFA